MTGEMIYRVWNDSETSVTFFVLQLFFVFLSFFGTGNIGSVSSFDPSSTRCFVSVFSPWVMMLLMLVKILAPFLLVSSFWRALLPSSRDVERNFGILLLLCQAMSLVMFFKVRNTGSWLDIGMSISHFVIVQATTLFLLLFHFIAHYLVTRELLGPPADLPTTKIDVTSSQKRLWFLTYAFWIGFITYRHNLLHLVMPMCVNLYNNFM